MRINVSLLASPHGKFKYERSKKENLLQKSSYTHEGT